MNISIREFREEDIPYKVKWINDEENNKYLHYDLPLKEDKTLIWFKTLESRKDRADYTITFNGNPAGLIGILNIDNEAKKGEYYICLGGSEYKGKGIASIATDLLIKKMKQEYALDNIYLYTEVDNVGAQKLFEKAGFIKQDLLKRHLIYNGRTIDRYYYTLDINNYLQDTGELKVEDK